MRSQETRYDYTSFIEFLKMLDRGLTTDETSSTRTTTNEIDRIMDRDLACINAVVRGYDADWDTLTLNRGKNGYFYRKPDGLWMLVHWDGDRTFGNANETIIGGLRGVRTYFNHAPIKRTMNYYMTELLTKYTKDSVRTETWMAMEDESARDNPMRASRYTSWFRSRERAAESYIRGAFDEDFKLEDADITTSEDTVAIKGTSPSSIYTLRVEGHPEATVVWEDDTDWTISGIRPKMGENSLKVTGLGHEGDVRSQLDFTITKTSGAAPILYVDSNPTSNRIAISDELVLDASASIDPDGSSLTLEWIQPQGVSSFSTEQDGKIARLQFQDAGVYVIGVRGTSEAGKSSETQIQVSVYENDGFSPFNDPVLASTWSTSNVTQLANFSPSSWYSLLDQPGRLTIQVLEDSAKPLGLPMEGLPEPVNVIDFETDWSFDDSNTDHGSAWTAPDFDDSAWKTGKGLFGFESSDLGEPLRTAFNRDSAAGLVTYYMRTEFEFDREPVGSQLTIDHFLDDGVVYYLNGKEIGRINMPEGEINHTTRSLDGVSNAELEFGVLNVAGTGLLQEGTNVLAAELHNEKPGSSDVVLGTRLNIASRPKSDGGGSLENTVHPWITRELPASTNWSLETKLTLETLQTGDFLAGLQVESQQGENAIRYALGYDGGTMIGAYLITAGSGAARIADVHYDASSTVEVRLSRVANELIFDWNDGAGWMELHRAALADARRSPKAAQCYPRRFLNPCRSVTTTSYSQPLVQADRRSQANSFSASSCIIPQASPTQNTLNCSMPARKRSLSRASNSSMVALCVKPFYPKWI